METTGGNEGMRLGSLLGKTKKSEHDQSEQDQFAPYRLTQEKMTV